jgi:hypothetical protein
VVRSVNGRTRWILANALPTFLPTDLPTWLALKGSKRFRSGAWRLVVPAPNDPLTGRRRNIYETLHAPNNRAGAKVADTRLAELIVAASSGQAPLSERRGHPRSRGPTVADLARDWQEANHPRHNNRIGGWLGWSPKTAITVGDNFRLHILPAIGPYLADQVTGLHLDQLYQSLETRGRLSPSAILRCHGQVRAMFNWAVRKKLVPANPAPVRPARKPPRASSSAMGRTGRLRPKRAEGSAQSSTWGPSHRRSTTILPTCSSTMCPRRSMS